MAIERLIEETRNVELERLYSVAERLHANYYENFLTSISIRVCIEDAKRLIDKLKKYYLHHKMIIIAHIRYLRS